MGYGGIGIHQSAPQLFQVLKHFLVIVELLYVHTDLSRLLHDFKRVVQVVSAEGSGRIQSYICESHESLELCFSVSVLVPEDIQKMWDQGREVSLNLIA